MVRYLIVKKKKQNFAFKLKGTNKIAGPCENQSMLILSQLVNCTKFEI